MQHGSDTQRVKADNPAWGRGGLESPRHVRHDVYEKATAGHLPVVLGLVNEASEWLRARETNQWAAPWPPRETRDKRILTGLQNEKTWIVWDGDIAAATVTIASKPNPDVWQNPACTCDLSEKAIYVHRLITARSYAGTGLGTELINWAGLRGKHRNRAKWIRIDVWTSNEALHAYYENIGFERRGNCPDPSYPSGALFQKPIAAIPEPARPQFTEDPHLVVRAADRELACAYQAGSGDVLEAALDTGSVIARSPRGRRRGPGARAGVLPRGHVEPCYAVSRAASGGPRTKSSVSTGHRHASSYSSSSSSGHQPSRDVTGTLRAPW